MTGPRGSNGVRQAQVTLRLSAESERVAGAVAPSGVVERFPLVIGSDACHRGFEGAIDTVWERYPPWAGGDVSRSAAWQRGEAQSPSWDHRANEGVGLLPLPGVEGR